MEPLSKQVVDVNCDVSYKFFFDLRQMESNLTRCVGQLELGMDSSLLLYLKQLQEIDAKARA